MDLHIQTKTNNCNANSLNFGDIFWTSLTKLVLGAKDSICSTIKGNVLLHCHKFLVFVIAAII